MIENGLFLQLAAPGSGKTASLADLVATVLNDPDEGNDMTVVLTFTREAASEIQKRIASVGGAEHMGRRLLVGTMHGIAARLIHRYRVGNQMPLQAVHGDGRVAYKLSEIVADVMKMSPHYVEAIKSSGVPLNVGTIAGRLTSLLDILPVETDYGTARLAPFFVNMEIAKFASECLTKWSVVCSAVNFTDFSRVIPEAVKIIRGAPTSPLVFSPARVMVDEGQDISPREIEFIDALSRKARSLHVVGDLDQRIYDFRGGGVIPFVDIGNHLSMAGHLKANTVIMPDMNASYRCPDVVAKSVHSLLSARPEAVQRRFFGHAEGSVSAGWFGAESDEVDVISGAVASLGPRRYGGVAILGRTHQAIEPFMLKLISEQVPVRVMRGDDPVSKIVMGRISQWLRIALSPADLEAGKQILRNGWTNLGPRTVSKLERRLSQRESVYRTLLASAAEDKFNRPQVEAICALSAAMEKSTQVLRQSDTVLGWLQWLVDNRLENLSTADSDAADVSRVIDFAWRLATACQTPTRFLDATSEQNSENHVSVGTFHSSKGREWQNVFMVGMTKRGMESLSSHLQNSFFAPGVLDAGEDGERRLVLVAMTRASQTTAMTWSGGPDNVSRYVVETGVDISENPGIGFSHAEPARPAQERRKQITQQLSLF